jgi:DNA adenine methylase
MGSASLFFSICPRRALLSDLNAELVEAYLSVRDNPRAVHQSLGEIPRGKASYYKLRSAGTIGTSAIERAARFIFLNRFCFNGLYRTNTAGVFNVPYSASKTGGLPSLSELRAVSQSLKQARIQCCDFATILNQVRTGDFVYLDPPFAVANRRIFRQYGPSTFGVDDLNRLAKLLDTIDSKGATFVVSYALSAESLRVFSNWHLRRVRIQRNISGFAKHRRRAIEIIVSNVAD